MSEILKPVAKYDFGTTSVAVYQDLTNHFFYCITDKGTVLNNNDPLSSVPSRIEVLKLLSKKMRRE
jgi:hypothetical protein